MIRLHPTILLLFVAGPMCLGGIAAAQEPGTGGGISVGVGFVNGSLAFEGQQFPETGVADFKIESTVSAPTVRAGALYFFDQAFGLDVSTSVGFSEIELPTALTQDGGVLKRPKLRAFPWDLRAHLLYRFSFGEGDRVAGVQFEFGSSVIGYSIQDNEFAVPSADDPNELVGNGRAIIVSTTVVGPSAGLGGHVPLGESIDLDLGVRAIMPTFTRESPQSSGRPGGGLGLNAYLAATYSLSKTLGLRFDAGFSSITVDFDGRGDRGTGEQGVQKGESSDTYITTALSAVYKL